MAAERCGMFGADREEVKLLSLLQGGETAADSNHAQVAPIWQTWANGFFERVMGLLNQSGCSRMAAQSCTKFKHLKKAFFEAIERWDGIPPIITQPLHFDALHQLWEDAGRPGWQKHRHACNTQQ